MKRTCNFDLEGVCYAPVCFSKVECGAKVGGKVIHASEVAMKERSKSVYGDIVVMQPTVVNVDNTGPENVSLKRGGDL